MEKTETILKKLQYRRQQLGIPYREIAKRAGVGIVTVQRALNGGKGVRLDTILAIADVLGVSIEVHPIRSVKETREEQARKKAKILVSMAQGTSGLESQGVDDETLKEMEDNIVHELLAGKNFKVWGV